MLVLLLLSLLVPPSLAARGGVATCTDSATCADALSQLQSNVEAIPDVHSSIKAWLGAALKLGYQELPSLRQQEALSSLSQQSTETTHGGTNSSFCPHQAAFEFIVNYQATVRINSTVQFDASGFDACFPSMNVQYSDHSPGGNTSGGDVWGYVHFTVPLPSKLICSDAYVLGTKYGMRTLDVGTIDQHINITTKMYVNITYLPGEYEEILQNGLQIMVKPCGNLGTIQSLLNTVALFYDKNVTKIREANKQFLTYRGVYDAFVNRPLPMTITPIDKKMIQSGDSLQVVKLDGLDPLIAWGTGGRTGHTTLVVWNRNNTVLYICESTDASPFGSYWPPPFGVIKTPFDQWMKQAQEATFVVNLLPLSETSAKAWDNNKFWDWFEKVEGMPYGYHVMLYSFLDTFHPAQNLPLPLTDRSIDFMLPYLDRVVGNDDKAIGSNMYALIGEGLNHRLGTHCVGQHMQNCLSDELVKRNLSYAKATAIPENDSWLYDKNGSFPGNLSMMCSAFVANAYKVGLSSQVWPEHINSHEFTPKDVYQLDLYDKNGRFDSKSCPGEKNVVIDPKGRGNYCQLLGEFVLVLPGFNSIKLYEHMNDHCSAQWPGYKVTRPC